MTKYVHIQISLCHLLSYLVKFNLRSFEVRIICFLVNTNDTYVKKKRGLMESNPTSSCLVSCDNIFIFTNIWILHAMPAAIVRYFNNDNASTIMLYPMNHLLKQCNECAPKFRFLPKLFSMCTVYF